MVAARSVVIVDAVRSPMAVVGADGVFSELSSVELLAQVLRGLLDRTDVDPLVVDDVIAGRAGPHDEVPVSLGSRAWLAARLPGLVASTVPTPGAGAGSRAVHLAVQRVLAKQCGVVVAGGVESRSTTCSREHPGAWDDWVAAEMMCARWKLTREQLDDYALQSQRRAAEVAAANEFRDEIVPVTVGSSLVRRTVSEDTTVHPELTAGDLAELATVGERTGWGDRFPETKRCVTAGNSALPAEGASVVLLSDERRARDLGLRARARIHCVTVAACGDDPIATLTGQMSAAATALKRRGLSLRQMDHFEVCESSAAIPLAWQAEFDIDPDMLNPRGGAIALGHPGEASCARMLTTMLNALETTGGRYGLQVMGTARGPATLFIVERP